MESIIWTGQYKINRLLQFVSMVGIMKAQAVSWSHCEPMSEQSSW